MNSSLFNFKSNKQNILKKYFIAIVPLLLFGVYKNGVNLLLNNVSIITILKLLIFPIFGFVFGLIIDFSNSKKLSIDFYSLIGLLIGLAVPYSCNLLIFVCSMLVLFLLSKFDSDKSFNHIAVVSLLIAVCLAIFAKLDYRTIIEVNNEYEYSLFDKFIGFNQSGIFISSILSSFIGLIILCFSELYKRNIAIISLISYLVVVLFNIIFHGYFETFNLIFSGANIFCFVYLAPMCIFSPISKNRSILFAVLIGVVSGIVSILGLYQISGFIAIIFANIVEFIISAIKK